MCQYMPFFPSMLVDIVNLMLHKQSEFLLTFVNYVSLHFTLVAVTTCPQATVALNILRERKGCFDVVLSDVHMPDMDGYKLLEHVGLEMDLPVISEYHSFCYKDVWM